jgi:GT2 family glycosyltransferase
VADHAVIGWIHGGTVRAEFCASLLSIAMEGSTPLDAILTLESGPNISTARNKLCDDFLRGQTAPWLFMVDTDMVLQADALDRLIAAADPAERPVLGGLCWSLSQGERYPTMYELVQCPDKELAFRRRREWPEDSVVRVSATGAACLLVHRDALEAVEKISNDPPAPWFRESAAGGRCALIGEDLTFCLRCAAAGIPVHVHTGVRAGHMKTTMLI